MEFNDPRTDGRMAATGPVTMYHASEADASMRRGEGIRPSGSGEIWLAIDRAIADLQWSIGRDQSIATVTVKAQLLVYERSHDDVHLSYQLDGDPLSIQAVDVWPPTSGGATQPT